MENATTQTAQFDAWAIVEIMGHVKLAGKVKTETFGSTVLLRVDVPETPKQPSHTQYYGMGSIYSLKPCDEETARLHADVLNVSPINEYSVQMHINKQVENRTQIEVDRQLKRLSDAKPEPVGSTYDNDDDLPY